MLTVYEFMEDNDNAELSYEEWEEQLEEAVAIYNEEHGTNFHPKRTFLKYVHDKYHNE